jgi:hypothetical protein
LCSRCAPLRGTRTYRDWDGCVAPETERFMSCSLRQHRFSRGRTPPCWNESGGSLRRWMRRPPAGYAHWNGSLLANIWSIFPSIRFGGCFGGTRFRWSSGVVGASVPIRRSRRRPPTSSRSTCNLRRTLWCCRWMKCAGLVEASNSKALTGFNHEYKRYGTTTLFAALEIATGLVKAGHYRRAGGSTSCPS